MHMSLDNTLKASALTTYMVIRSLLVHGDMRGANAKVLTDDEIDTWRTEWLAMYGFVRETLDSVEDVLLRQLRGTVTSHEFVQLP